MTLPNPAQALARIFTRRRPATDSRSLLNHRWSARRSWRGILLRAILTAAVIGILFWQVPWRAVVSTAAGMQAGLLTAAILLWVPAHLLQFTRWAILAKHAGKEATWPDIFRSYWVGFTLAVVTPGRVGQFGRCFALRVPVARAVGVSLLERFYAAVVLNGAGPLALAIMLLAGISMPVGSWRFPLLVGLCLMGTAVLLLGLFPRILLPALFWIVRRLPLREKLERMVGVLDGMRGGLTLALVLLSISSMAVALLQFVLLLRAMDITVPLGWGMVAVMVNFFFKASLPISIAGLGVGEWTAVLCLGWLGIDPAAAVAGSLLLFSINVLTPALLGIPVVPTLRLRATKAPTIGNHATRHEAEMTAPLEQTACDGS